MAKGRKTGGRRKGTPNKATLEVKEVCGRLIDDPVYQQRLSRRLRAGTLSPAVECMLWHYAKGKPREEVRIDSSVHWDERVRRMKAARARIAEIS